MQIKSDIIHSSWPLEPIRLAGTLLCSPFHPWVCQINGSLRTPLHYISPFSKRTLYIPGKINHTMKIWINLNKWLHLICLTLKTMTAVYTQSSKLLSALAATAWAAEATDRCSHSPKEHRQRSRWGSGSQVCVLARTACTSRIRKMTDCRYFSKLCVRHCSGRRFNSFSRLHLEAVVRFCWLVWHCEGGVITFWSSQATQRLCEECCRCPPSCRPQPPEECPDSDAPLRTNSTASPFFPQQMYDLVKMPPCTSSLIISPWNRTSALWSWGGPERPELLAVSL